MSLNKLCDPQNFNVPFIVSGAHPEVNSNALEGFGSLVSWVKAVQGTGKKKRHWEDDKMFCVKKDV